VVENAVFPGCSRLTVLTCSSLADVQKFKTLGPFIVSRSLSYLCSNMILAIGTLKLENGVTVQSR
jgi:hypothetical protein